ncbi:Hypothetical Protein SLY_0910 [Strawberry lethal yellows phytoplasma (CPA) str. NZSb11]|uniref:Uncharacterized protein n=1 Tax=Strawberry lethal yellows phytoplasma (CPA) str. NZSb11 TaxID=980422 RepID=R4RN83_PHYAS|nr:Hypothetical Protein SLY_0910 [Strawberry lethal yellows phytoplasma (CPA) str. NZSb11]
MQKHELLKKLINLTFGKTEKKINTICFDLKKMNISKFFRPFN